MAKRTTLKRVLQGVGLYWRGLRMWGSDPVLMMVGIVPGLITAALFTVGLIALWNSLDPMSRWILGLFTQSQGQWTDAVAVLIALGIAAASVVVVVYGFAAVTLVIGTPFFERISARVDQRLGHAPVKNTEGWMTSLGRGLAESFGRLALTVPLGIALFFINLIPVVGTATSFTIGVLFGGWFLSLELTAFPLSERGHIALRQRRALLKSQRPLVLGFGAMAFVMFLLPGGAVLSMPAAVAGGTLLSRHVLAEPTEVARQAH